MSKTAKFPKTDNSNIIEDGQNEVIINSNEANNELSDSKKALWKRTFVEFVKSLLIGIFPVAADYAISTVIIYLFYAKAAGIPFFDILFKDVEKPQTITTVATVFGYGLSAIVAYLFSVLFVFDNKQKGRTGKGIAIFIAVELFAYGFNILLGWLFNMFMATTFAFVTRICVSYVVVFLLRKFLVFSPDKQTKKKSANITDGNSVENTEEAAYNLDEVNENNSIIDSSRKEDTTDNTIIEEKEEG